MPETVWYFNTYYTRRSSTWIKYNTCYVSMYIFCYINIYYIYRVSHESVHSWDISCVSKDSQIVFFFLYDLRSSRLFTVHTCFRKHFFYKCFFVKIEDNYCIDFFQVILMGWILIFLLFVCITKTKIWSNITKLIKIESWVGSQHFQRNKP